MHKVKEKSNIEDFVKKYEQLSEDLIYNRINLFEAVESLMKQTRGLLWSLVNYWQMDLSQAQKKIKHCPRCNHKLYTHKITYPKYIFPFGRTVFYHRKLRCPNCKYRESLLKCWLPLGIEHRITPLVGEMLICLSCPDALLKKF